MYFPFLKVLGWIKFPSNRLEMALKALKYFWSLLFPTQVKKVDVANWYVTLDAVKLNHFTYVTWTWPQFLKIAKKMPSGIYFFFQILNLSSFGELSRISRWVISLQSCIVEKWDFSCFSKHCDSAGQEFGHHFSSNWFRGKIVMISKVST